MFSKVDRNCSFWTMSMFVTMFSKVASYESKCVYMWESVMRFVEQFLLLSQCLQKSTASNSSKCVYMRELVKTFLRTICDYWSNSVDSDTDICGCSHWSETTHGHHSEHLHAKHIYLWYKTEQKLYSYMIDLPTIYNIRICVCFPHAKHFQFLFQI